MEIKEIIFLFSPQNEDKLTLSDMIEKSNRRKESLYLDFPQIREMAYKGFRFHEGILELTNEYSKIIKSNLLKNAIEEINCLTNILNNFLLPSDSMASTLIAFKPRSYETLLSLLNIDHSKSKSLGRIKNIKNMSIAFSKGKISLSKYNIDLMNHVTFFNSLMNHMKNLNEDNAFALILRYDVKTRKRKKKL